MGVGVIAESECEWRGGEQKKLEKLEFDMPNKKKKGRWILVLALVASKLQVYMPTIFCFEFRFF